MPAIARALEKVSNQTAGSKNLEIKNLLGHCKSWQKKPLCWRRAASQFRHLGCETNLELTSCPRCRFISTVFWRCNVHNGIKTIVIKMSDDRKNMTLAYQAAGLERVCVQKQIHRPVGRRWWIYVSMLITALSVFYSDISLKIEIAIS